jgi:hypothetical protein
MFVRSAAIVAAFLSVEAARAEPVCGPIQSALEVFRAQHGEVPYVSMRDGAGNRLIVLANPESRSWSLLVVPAGSEAIACLVATGTDIAPAQGRKGRES